MKRIPVMIFVVVATLLCATSLKAKSHYPVVGFPNAFESLDPIHSVSLHNRFVLRLMYETLVNINLDQEIEPGLASSWKVSADRKVVTMELQKGVTFSDGSKLQAQHVKDSFVRLCDPSSAGKTALSVLKGCIDPKVRPAVEVRSEHSVRFHIEGSPTLFLHQLSSPSAGIFLFQSSGKILGSGPYVLSKYSSSEITLEKNPKYIHSKEVLNDGLALRHIRESLLPAFDGAQKPDVLVMYRSAPLDGVDAGTYEIIDEAPDIAMKLIVNHQRFPFNYEIVRKAIMHELYNQNNIHKCSKNTLKAYGIIPGGLGGSRAHVAPVSLPSIAPEKVFSQVPKLQNGASVTLHRFEGRKNACEENEISKAMKKYNISVKMKYHSDYKKLWQHYLKHDIDGFLELFVYVNREAYTKFVYYLSNGKENFSNLRDDYLDGEIAKSWKQTTPIARFRQYGKINEYILQHAIAMALFYTNSRSLVHKCFSPAPKEFASDPFMGLAKLKRKPGCK